MFDYSETLENVYLAFNQHIGLKNKKFENLIHLTFNTLSCQNYFFQGVWGVYKIVVEIPEGWGVNLVVKNWKFRGGGEAYVKFPPWWGYGYFLELHNAYNLYI